MAFELVPFSDLKFLLDLSGSSYDDQPALKVIHDRVLYAIESYIGRELEYKERTESKFIHGIKTAMIPLVATPIEAISAIEISSNLYGSVSLTDSDYDITSYGIKLGSKYKNCLVKVTYTGGYSEVPYGIKQAALYQISYEFQGKDHIGATSMSTDGGSVSLPELGLLKETKRVLDPFLHPLKG